MKKTAAVCRKAGEPLSIEEIEVDPPKAWEVRIKVICTSLCHTDLSYWKLDAVSKLIPSPSSSQKFGQIYEHVFLMVELHVTL